MKQTDRRRYESLASVFALCIEHRTELEGTPLGAGLLAQFDAALKSAGTSFTRQSDGRQTAYIATRDRRKAVRTLRNTANATLRVGRALDRQAGISREFPVLRVGNHRQLIADANAIHGAMADHGDALAANRLSLDDMAKQIADVDAAIRAQGDARETHVAARETVADELRAAALAADALEPLFFRAMEKDPDAIARWKNARRIGPRRHQKDAPAPEPAQPAAQPGPAPTTPSKVA